MTSQRNWFIFQGDHHIGPFSQEEIMSKIMLMELTKEDLIWKEGERDWMPVSEWSEFISLFPAASDIPHEMKLGLDFKAPEDLNPDQVANEVEPGLIFEEEDSFEEEVVSEELSPVEEAQPEEEDAGPPPLPPLPVEPEAEPEPEPKTEPEDPTVELPPDLPPLPPLEEEEEVELVQEEPEQYEGEYEREDEYHAERETIAEESFQLSHLKFYMSAAVGLVGLLVFVSYLWSALNSTPKAFGLTKGDRDALLHVTEKSYRPDKGIEYKIRPTSDLSALWLGANYPGQGWAILRLKTKEGRYMGEAPVELLAQASYESGLSFFDEIEILQGESIVAGEYTYTLELTPGGTLLRWNRLMKDIPVLGALFSSESEMEKQVLKGSLLLSPMAKKNFDSKLSDYHIKLDRNLVQPMKERKQRYETFLGLLEQMGDLYKNTLNRISKGNTIYLFEDQYNKQIGPMMRDLIIDSHKRHLSTLNLDPKQSEAYLELTEFGKEIGALASFMVTETKKHNHINKTTSIRLSKTMQAKVEELMKKGLLHIDELTQKLKEFK